MLSKLLHATHPNSLRYQLGTAGPVDEGTAADMVALLQGGASGWPSPRCPAPRASPMYGPWPSNGGLPAGRGGSDVGPVTRVWPFARDVNRSTPARQPDEGQLGHTARDRSAEATAGMTKLS